MAHDSGAQVTIKHDDTYYLDVVIFQVEDTLFRVPKYFFVNHSDIFATTFSLPQTAETPEGSSDANPFKLEGVTKEEFTCFLKVAYPLKQLPQNPQSLYTISSEEWQSALKLATLWRFHSLRQLALSKLSTMKTDPVSRIMMGRNFRVAKWLSMGYTALARREEPPSVQEANILGVETIVFIFHVREASNNSNRSNFDFAPTIRKVFAKELQDVEADNMLDLSSLDGSDDDTEGPRNPRRR